MISVTINLCQDGNIENTTISLVKVLTRARLERQEILMLSKCLLAPCSALCLFSCGGGEWATQRVASGGPKGATTVGARLYRAASAWTDMHKVKCVAM